MVLNLKAHGGLKTRVIIALSTWSVQVVWGERNEQCKIHIHCCWDQTVKILLEKDIPWWDPIWTVVVHHCQGNMDLGFLLWNTRHCHKTSRVFAVNYNAQVPIVSKLRRKQRYNMHKTCDFSRIFAGEMAVILPCNLNSTQPDTSLKMYFFIVVCYCSKNIIKFYNTREPKLISKVIHEKPVSVDDVLQQFVTICVRE